MYRRNGKFCKNGHRLPKKLLYGATRGKYWCQGCDAELVPEWAGIHEKSIKKRERQKAKKQIKKDLNE